MIQKRKMKKTYRKEVLFMYIKIHRGTAQIGGNIIEIGTAQTKLIFDAGTNLPPLDHRAYNDNIAIEGLTFGKPAFDAVFVSHHHNDHCGLLERILPDIPVWAGRETSRILEVISDFTGGVPSRVTNFFAGGGNCMPTQIGDITVTPIGVDHSAYDAYMFFIQADGKNVLYTGDYRAVEELPDTIQSLLGIAGRLDVLITEGTNIDKPIRAGGLALQNEEELAQTSAEQMKRYNGTAFVLCSSTNEPRIRAIDQACAEAGRVPCHDLFLTAVRGEAGITDRCKPKHFVANHVDQERHPRAYWHFTRYHQEHELVGIAALVKSAKPMTIFVRTSMLQFMKHFLDERSERDSVLFYSMWAGYRETEPVKRLFKFCDAHKIEVVPLHCSGHAYGNAIKALIWRLNPTVLIPIHCDKQSRATFTQLHPNCKLLEDNECFVLE